MFEEVTKKSIDEAKSWIARWDKKAEGYRQQAKAGTPRQRGGYLSQATQAQSKANVWRFTLLERQIAFHKQRKGND